MKTWREIVSGLPRPALLALLAVSCSQPVTGVPLSLTDMQKLYPETSNPPPEYRIRSEDIHGEMFELFDKALVLAIFQIPGEPKLREAETVVQEIAPTVRIKIAWSIDGGEVYTSTYGPSPLSASTYLPPVHGARMKVELLELDGVACSRKAELRIR